MHDHQKDKIPFRQFNQCGTQQGCLIQLKSRLCFALCQLLEFGCLRLIIHITEIDLLQVKRQRFVDYNFRFTLYGL